MKKLLLLLPLLAIICSPVMFTGCQSTPQRVVYNAQETTQTSVEGLMALWDLKIQSGEVTLDQERKVMGLLSKYQKSALYAHDLIDAYIRISLAGNTGDSAADIKAKADAAAKEASTALTELVKLLATFGVK